MTEETPPSFSALLKGTSHRGQEAKDYVFEMQRGANLVIDRDYKNEFDANAIRVLEPITGLHLGFVAKEVAQELAPWMDQGWHFTCTGGDHASNYMVWLEIEPILPEKEKSKEEALDFPPVDRVHDDEVPF